MEITEKLNITRNRIRAWNQNFNFYFVFQLEYPSFWLVPFFWFKVLRQPSFSRAFHLLLVRSFSIFLFIKILFSLRNIFFINSTFFTSHYFNVYFTFKSCFKLH